MFKFVDVEQNTEEWYKLRAGKLTSSKLGVIMASSKEYIVISFGKSEFYVADNNTKKMIKKCHVTKINAEREIIELKKKDLTKAFTATAKKYAVSIAIEQITGKAIASTYSNEHMVRGHEQEPIARMMYEDENFTDVTNGGFFESECGFIGCSPDGLTDSGVIEIKSVIASTQYATVKRNNVDPSYKWQCVGNLKFTGKDWIDYVSYCSEFPEDNQLFTFRLEAKDLSDEFKMIESRIAEFKSLVEEVKNRINEGSK